MFQIYTDPKEKKTNIIFQTETTKCLYYLANASFDTNYATVFFIWFAVCKLQECYDD